MQTVLTAQEMREVDYETVIKLRVTEKQLMELAGKESCNIIQQKFGAPDGSLSGKRFLVVCGKGNNGGDGIVLSRHFINADATVDIVHLCQESLLKQDGAATLKSLKQYLIHTDRLRVFEADEFIPAAVEQTKYDFIIDAILGTGYKRTDNPKGVRRKDPNNPFLPKISDENFANPDKASYELQAELQPKLSHDAREGVLFINMKREKDKSVVIAIDVSSGLDSTSGEVADVAVNADLTITLAFLKTGLFLGKGREVSGEIAVADISIPKFLTKDNQCKLTDDAFVRTTLPRRSKQSAKQNNGKVLVIAGSQSEKGSMMGAALMAIKTAVKSGAGYVCAAVPPSAFNVVHSSTPEAIVIGQDEQTILERIEWADAVLIGCGLGRTPESQSFIAKLMTNPALKDKKIVIDADALFAISELDLLPHLKLSNAILTPHLKELERLIHVPTNEIDSDRLYYTKAFINEYPLGLLLKGAPTLIAAQGKLFLNNSGTEALATAGTGDVLAGLIASLAGQGLSIENAAAVGTYLHGIAGKEAGKAASLVSATDVIDAIESVIAEIRP